MRRKSLRTLLQIFLLGVLLSTASSAYADAFSSITFNNFSIATVGNNPITFAHGKELFPERVLWKDLTEIKLQPLVEAQFNYSLRLRSSRDLEFRLFAALVRLMPPT